jgi:hypothetical protein
MSQLVKTKHQANFKDFKRSGVFKGLGEQQTRRFKPFVCKLGFFTPVLNWFTHAKKGPIYTRTP